MDRTSPATAPAARPAAWPVRLTPLSSELSTIANGTTVDAPYAKAALKKYVQLLEAQRSITRVYQDPVY